MTLDVVPSFLAEGLCFNLEVEDGWPPVTVEEIPFERVLDGYRIEMPPLFVKDLSVGDVISVERDEKGYVSSWSHLGRSNNTTIWLARLKEPNGIKKVLEELRGFGCNTVGLDIAGCYALDVPSSILMERVDELLATLDGTHVAIAYPSLRHAE